MFFLVTKQIFFQYKSWAYSKRKVKKEVQHKCVDKIVYITFGHIRTGDEIDRVVPFQIEDTITVPN